MGSTPHLTTHNLALLQLAYKSSPILANPLIPQQLHHQFCDIMTPNNPNQVLVAKTQIVSKSQFAHLEGNTTKQWEIPTQFRMTQVKNLGENHSNADLPGSNHSPATSNVTPAATAAPAAPGTSATTATRSATATPAIPAPVPPRMRAPLSTAMSVRLSIEYVIWLLASLPANVKKSSGSGRGKAPPKWTKVVSKLLLPNWLLVPTNWDWGLAKRKIILLTGASCPYLSEAITKNDNGGLPPSFLTLRKPSASGFISKTLDQLPDAKADAVLVLLNGTQEERAPLEKTRARLTANPNAELEHPATPHAVNLRKHHLLKRLERGAPSSEGELCHKALWAWARKMDKPNVTLDIPPKTTFFEWQVASPTRSTTKRKNTPASELSGSPANTKNAPGDVSTEHTESADVSVFGNPPKRPTGGLPNDTDHLSVSASQTSSIEVLQERHFCPPSSIEILGGMTKIDARHQNGRPGPPPALQVVSPINLAGLNRLCIAESTANTKRMSGVLPMDEFLDLCGIELDNFHTKWIVRDHNITTWTHWRTLDKDKIIGLGIKSGPTRLIHHGVIKIQGVSLNDNSRAVLPEV
ncbi:hypothetical protein PCASD_22011 [Puccinia coronata f. sp. avenae]|uniref:Uncharacterized protein n=1 Tax=Puccinia coronata f. sp. avenae TaxID=200324 RepID=A0A2N5TZH6_9BASI|nr:hypothetical protein PCASD_22011 [Puccinia coronata f. sp. avenae]